MLICNFKEKYNSGCREINLNAPSFCFFQVLIVHFLQLYQLMFYDKAKLIENYSCFLLNKCAKVLT